MQNVQAVNGLRSVSQDERDLRLFRGFRQEMLADLSTLEKNVLSYLVQGLSIQDMVTALQCEPSAIYLVTRQLRYCFATRTLPGIVSHAIWLGVIRSDGIFISQSDT